MNTHYDLTADDGGEVLRDPESLSEWLATHDLLDGGFAPRLLTTSSGPSPYAKACVPSRPPTTTNRWTKPPSTRLHRASAGAFTEIRLEPDGPQFTVKDPTTLDSALGALLAGVARAMLDGTWARVKACPGRDCGWVFYDHSRNQSARWCSMKVCGDREKARAYYQRRTGSDR